MWIQQAVRSKRVDLRKVAGEVNPADLFTKHSLTRERLIDLSKLYELEFRGGRATSAPATRKSTGTRPTMAEVHSMTETASRDDATHDATHDRPIMPHRIFSQDELDARYPSIEAVEAVDEDEKEQDPLLQEGERIAKQIMEQANAVGRKRVNEGNPA